ncbi:MAM and LDL-receptor class A domain-containing protein 1-like [Antedon mediterranea]|uniref:MAM and LDL-receptor class A domain-containing protein 1-like n=1 Tax=Antedon mediterranea TaxID=105859 RepID=UPI003AF8E09A
MFTDRRYLLTNEGDAARLTSPTYPPPSNYYGCVSFWYHMRGDDIGYLNTYLNVNGVLQQIWSFGNIQTDDFWRIARQSVFLTDDFQIMFEGIAGRQEEGDIAIDDVQFSIGMCSGFFGSCTFETDTCGWTNAKTGDEFDWVRHSGGSYSDFTGPSYDHTYGNQNGWYMYIEASFPRTAGERARLESEGFSPNGPRCFQFWYHMYGNFTGTLNVRNTFHFITQTHFIGQLLYFSTHEIFAQSIQ